MKPIEEYVRGVLPYYLLSRYQNVILSVNVKGEKAYLKRSIDLYDSSIVPLFIPGASLLLYIPYVKTDYEVMRDEENNRYIITIKDIDGFTRGYVPTKIPFRTIITGNTLKDDIKKQEFVSTKDPTDFEVNMLVRRVMRIEAGKYFASKVRYSLAKEKWRFTKEGYGKLRIVHVKEGGLKTNIEIRTTFFSVQSPFADFETYAPGIIPGVLDFFSNDDSIPVEGKVKDKLLEVGKNIADIGKSFTSVSLLQRAYRSTFSYVIGEVDADEKTLKVLKDKTESSMYWVTGYTPYKSVRNNIYIDTESKKLILSVTFYPFVPPASTVLNYPPFHIAPLSAIMRERRNQLEYIVGEVRSRMRRRGVDVIPYISELDPLTDSGVSIEDLRIIHKEGYPTIRSIDRLLRKMEKIEYIGDITSISYGNLRKVDEVLVSSIEPVTKKEDKKVGKKKREEELVL